MHHETYSKSKESKLKKTRSSISNFKTKRNKTIVLFIYLTRFYGRLHFLQESKYYSHSF